MNCNKSNQTPAQKVIRMIQGASITQMIHVAARLGIADLLKRGPKSCDELAGATGTHPQSLYRLLRGLASIGIFAETEERCFELTPEAQCLRSDAPDSVRTFAVWTGDEVNWKPWGQLLYSIQTGKTAFKQVFGSEIFEYFSKNPKAGDAFNRFMTERMNALVKAVASSYDFSKAKVIADIGGGQGLLLSTILKSNPKLRGILFDLPSVIKEAENVIEKTGVAERCELVGGSFFESISVTADIYILSSIIHDWDDKDAVTILKNCRKCMPRDSKLLLVETMIPPGNAPALGKLTDLNMLVLTGGMERTRSEFEALFKQTGFKLTNIIPTPSPMNIIEAVPHQ